MVILATAPPWPLRPPLSSLHFSRLSPTTICHLSCLYWLFLRDLYAPAASSSSLSLTASRYSYNLFSLSTYLAIIFMLYLFITIAI